MIIDTHAHLDDEKYFDDLDEVLKNAKKNGIEGILIPGADINDLKKAQKISHENENIYFAAGVHPYHHEQYDETILINFLKDEKCIAVGECGLDYFRLPDEVSEKEVEKKAQKEVFKKHIELAKKVNKPLIVHIRDANDDSKTILLENNAKEIGGVLHCYNASEHLLSLAQEGFYFGIGGVLTFKNAKNLVEVLEKIPQEKLLIETDAPYLTPHPHRGKRNEPSYTTFVVEKMAEILKKDVDTIENLTTSNAKRLFKAFAK
ncbi:TatD family hydrolase [Sulfurospirillum arcachonense]|uniref:TatD family hydrolase n=1 Tax=Sulfurospirillum arcachonense TaxID=57666 RepID=UPI000469BB01|nr:TatD family hydrolase [Sulfurospirillum arcachonense]